MSGCRESSVGARRILMTGPEGSPPLPTPHLTRTVNTLGFSLLGAVWPPLTLGFSLSFLFFSFHFSPSVSFFPFTAYAQSPMKKLVATKVSAFSYFFLSSLLIESVAKNGKLPSLIFKKLSQINY